MTRASGRTGGQESALEASVEADTLPGLTEDTKRRFKSPGFARMRLDWNREDSMILTRANAAAQKWVTQRFGDIYATLNEIYDIVREAEEEDGKPKLDMYGLPVWKKNTYGRPIESWGDLTITERDNFLFYLTTSLFTWEQRAQEAWSEAMYAKAIWEENYSIEFDAVLSGTVEDKESHAKTRSMEERYWAILLSYRSRLCDSLIRDVNQLIQTLRDSLRK